jgi:DNA-binding transcriptional LysR family regulator
VTPARYAAGEHVTVARKSLERGAVDEALELLGLERATTIIVGGFSSALTLARFSDLIATVPERHTGNLRRGMHTFSLPVSVPQMTVSMLWHPRLDADPAHRWLRRCVLDACVTSLGPSDA